MIYNICECNYLNGKRHIKVLDKFLSEQSYSAYFEHVKEISFFDNIDFFVKMIKYDAKLLLNLLNNSNIYSYEESKETFDLANKYIYDLSASFGTFIEFIDKKLIKKQNENIKNEYQKLKESIFNDNVYLFWYYLRNYIIHYDVIFTKFENSLKDGQPDLKIICTKYHLLKFKEWKHAKKYVLSLPEEVDFSKLIILLLEFIDKYYIEIIYLFKDKIFKTYNFTKKILKDYNVNSNIILFKYEKAEDLRFGKVKVEFFEFDRTNNLINNLNNHPKQKSTKLENI